MSTPYTTPPPPTLNVLISNPSPHILLITFNRPAQFNAMPREMHYQLDKLLAWYDAQPSLRVCIITGKGKAFCAGADLMEWNEKNKQGLTTSAEKWTDNGFGAVSNRRGKKPIIAAVNGVCLGGGMEMVLNCDMVIAHEKAKFGLPEVKIGVVAIAGALPRVTRILGRQRATEIGFAGEDVRCREDAELGIG